MITGQVIFRATPALAPDGTGRKLMIVVGVLAVPSDFRFEGEHQYPVFCEEEGEAGENLPLLLLVHHDGRDLTEEIRGHGLGAIVTSPIWRC